MFQGFKVSRFKGLKVSMFQGFKVSQFYSFKVSSFEVSRFQSVNWFQGFNVTVLNRTCDMSHVTCDMSHH